MKNKESILNVVHETAKGLHKAEIINTQTMREFDALCLTPVKELTPRQIQQLRQREKISQPVFAQYLNTSPSTVKQWESGEKHPCGTSLKLLNIVYRKGLRAIA